MEQLQTKRIRFSKETDTWLRVMKSRTDITPNLLCRLGFCLSLEEPGVPDNSKHPEDSEREINRYTLLGDYELVLVSLLRQRLQSDGIPLTQLDEQFRAHMHRGVVLLAGRVKELTDLAEIVGHPRT
ncbi:MAG: DNA sulfur modification protein DndE [Myxococcales bacterium]